MLLFCIIVVVVDVIIIVTIVIITVLKRGFDETRDPYLTMRDDLSDGSPIFTVIKNLDIF